MVIQTPFFRRLLLQSIFPLTLVATHATVQAAEEPNDTMVRLAGFQPAGLYTADTSLTFSEDTESPFEEEAATPGGPSQTPIDQAGPFFLVAPDTIEMIGTVDSDTPHQFDQLMTRHPGVTRLVMVDCPGSLDEDANHALARRVRNARLQTSVPAGGYVASGAVDLFLAGSNRIAARSAEFAVHSWRDEDGNEPQDFAADAPENLDYIRYYESMGLTRTLAGKFYALTNSVPFSQARMLRAEEMAQLGLAQLVG